MFSEPIRSDLEKETVRRTVVKGGDTLFELGDMHQPAA
jgi:hypothetical protein